MKYYSIYLDDLVLPVTPEGISTEIDNKNDTINLIDSDEYNMLRKPGLTTVEFKALLPAQEAHFTRDLKRQQEYLDKLEELKTDKEKKIFKFMIIRSDTNERLSDTYFPMATLEDYQINETSDYGIGDLEVQIKVKQFRDLANKDIEVEEKVVNKNKNGETKVSSTMVVKEKPSKEKPKEAPGTYEVKKGDTLWHIAERYLGDGARYKEIAEKNPQIQNPNLIFPGQKIKIGDENA